MHIHMYIYIYVCVCVFMYANSITHFSPTYCNHIHLIPQQLWIPQHVIVQSESWRHQCVPSGRFGGCFSNDLPTSRMTHLHLKSLTYTSTHWHLERLTWLTYISNDSLISRMNVDSQWHPVYKTFYRIQFCGNEQFVSKNSNVILVRQTCGQRSSMAVESIPWAYASLSILFSQTNLLYVLDIKM